MKILFLDIDGVCNSREYILKLDGLFDDPKFQMDPEAVKRINRITDVTGACIVVTSTWRLAFRHSAYPLRQLRECFASYKITGGVVDMTGVRNDGRRYEIQEWLDMHTGVDAFVILDDETIEGFPGHTIKTTLDLGVQDIHVDQVIDILGKNVVPIESQS